VRGDALIQPSTACAFANPFSQVRIIVGRDLFTGGPSAISQFAVALPSFPARGRAQLRIVADEPEHRGRFQQQLHFM
jgi:hypothetical protein